MIKRDVLHEYLNDLLKIEIFQDYTPNGLQIQGRPEIKKLVSGVTASQAFLDAAITAGADAVLVHHGYFWRGDSEPITGLKYHRFKKILNHDLNVFAYHLPLDAHPLYGNNARLGEILGFEVTHGFDEDLSRSIGLVGRLPVVTDGNTMLQKIATVLQRQPLHIPANRKISTIAWCTGGAQRYIEKALLFNVDAYVTGEVSEQTVHIAREAGIHFFAAGHHATERYGVQALGAHIASQFKISHAFIDIDNPA